MQTVECDAKGRLYLKQSLREKYGRRFVTVPARGEILLIPVPKDAVTDLREATSMLRGKSMRELKMAIEKTIRDQVRA